METSERLVNDNNSDKLTLTIEPLLFCKNSKVDELTNAVSSSSNKISLEVSSLPSVGGVKFGYLDILFM